MWLYQNVQNFFGNEGIIKTRDTPGGCHMRSFFNYNKLHKIKEMGYGKGRKMDSEALQLIMLALLLEKPRHGYELIKAIEERSHSFYIPSPGVIYPMLTYLEEIGYTTVEVERNKKCYHITTLGKEYIQKHEFMVDQILKQLEHLGRKAEFMQELYNNELTEGNSDDTQYIQDLYLIRKQLKIALFEKIKSSPEKLKSALEILKQTINAIKNL